MSALLKFFYGWTLYYENYLKNIKESKITLKIHDFSQNSIAVKILFFYFLYGLNNTFLIF